MRTSENSAHANFGEPDTGEVRRMLLPRTPVNRALGGFVCVPGPRFGSPFDGYTKNLASNVWLGDTMMDRNAASSRMDHEAEGAREQWLGAMRSLAEQIQKQQQYSQQMVQELTNTYMQLLNTPGSYVSGQAEQQQQTLQQMTQEVLGSYSQLFNIPLSYAQEGLRDAQFPIEGYDELTVEEVSGRIGNLSI